MVKSSYGHNTTYSKIHYGAWYIIERGLTKFDTFHFEEKYLDPLTIMVPLPGGWIFQHFQIKITKTNKNLVFYGHVNGMSMARHGTGCIYLNIRLTNNNGLQCQCHIMLWYCYNSTYNYRDHFQQYILTSWRSWVANILSILLQMLVITGHYWPKLFPIISCSRT